jgi:hypothetical protein
MGLKNGEHDPHRESSLVSTPADVAVALISGLGAEI